MLLSLFCGQNGVWAESQLVSQKMDLCNNIAEIQKLNDELSLEHTALMQDSEVISAHARRLGFVNEGEKIVKISGIPPKTQKAYSVGKFYKRSNIQFLPDYLCKIFGISVSILSLIIFFLVYLSEKHMTSQGVKSKNKIANEFTEVVSGNF